MYKIQYWNYFKRQWVDLDEYRSSNRAELEKLLTTPRFTEGSRTGGKYRIVEEDNEA